MSRSIIAACAGAALVAGGLVGASALGDSTPAKVDPPAAGATAARGEAQSRPPALAVRVARAQRAATIATRRANAANAANRTLRQRLARSEARLAALEAALAAPPPPPAPGPAPEPVTGNATPGDSTNMAFGRYEIVFKTGVPATPGQIKTDFVDCPPGHKAFGGGIWTGTLHLQNAFTNNIQQIASWPSSVGPEGTGRWSVRVINPAGADRGYRVYAACAGPGGP